MRCASPVFGILVAFCAVARACGGASAQSPNDAHFAAADTRAYPVPSLRSLNRAYSYAPRAASPWTRPESDPYAAASPRPLIRTVCVRLCDGYYWPISTHTASSRVAADATACQASCRSEARLFTLPEGSDDIAAMTDLTGRSYGRLETAFAYRTSLKAGCGCQSMPWSADAQQRHATYEREAVGALSRPPTPGVPSPSHP